MPMFTHCVYKLVFPNGKFYIGCTKNLKNRLVQHRCSGDRNGSLRTRAIAKFGIENAKVEVLTSTLPKHIAISVEAELIHENYDDPDCLNGTNPIGPSTKVKKKMRELMIRRHREGYYDHLKKNLQTKST